MLETVPVVLGIAVALTGTFTGAGHAVAAIIRAYYDGKIAMMIVKAGGIPPARPRVALITFVRDVKSNEPGPTASAEPATV